MKHIVRLTESDLHKIVKKSVNKILRESIYNEQILVTRNVDCSTIQEQQFVQMMLEDIMNAKQKWYDMRYQNDLNAHNERHKNTYENNKAHALKLAQKYCRTQRGQQIFYEKWMKLRGGSPEPPEFKWYDEITYFDVNLSPNEYGSNPTISCRDDDNTEAQIKYVFNRIKNNEWFRNAIGWNLIETGFRPQIKFIYDQERDQNWTDLRRKRDDDIMRFNSTLHYHGD